MLYQDLDLQALRFMSPPTNDFYKLSQKAHLLKLKSMCHPFILEGAPFKISVRHPAMLDMLGIFCVH